MINSHSSKSCRVTDFTEERTFKFDIFLNNMKKSILTGKPDASIDLGYYLIAYDQLYNFFLLLGGAFQFVAVDVKSKIKILQEYRNEELSKHEAIKNFSTVQSMINYEKMKDLLCHPTYVSGCRTLLRLHRGLDFFREFLRELYSVENHTKLNGVARDVYDKTLAEYHTFIVRNTARVAMQFLPTRSELLNKISHNSNEELTSIMQSFPEALSVMDLVYNRIQEIFLENDLLNLP